MSKALTYKEGSIFKELAIDKAKVAWEDHESDLTPVQSLPGAFQLKREDWFAPLGYGGINGSKLRQLIRLISDNVRGGGEGLVTAASVKSPQLSMASVVCRHFDIPCTLLLGGSKPRTAIKHENVSIAATFGAAFRFIKVGYNPALQSGLSKMLHMDEFSSCFPLEYGITDTRSDRHILNFHEVGSQQIKNFPDSADTLLLPAGSCNSCTSLLYGIHKYRPKNLKRIVLLGIGPLRLDFIDKRLAAIERETGESIRGQFIKNYIHHPKLAAEHNEQAAPDSPWTIDHYDLHGTKFVGYQDEMPYTYRGVELHPTYEGKVMTYLQKHKRTYFEREFAEPEKCVFWIIGSKPYANRLFRWADTL